MRKIKHILFYLVAVGGLLLLTIYITQIGVQLEPKNAQNQLLLPDNNSFSGFIKIINDNLESPISHFLMQLIIIVFSTRIFGFIFKKLGQPSVVGEILAGIVLGPSLLGMAFPAYLNYIFPLKAMDELHLFSRLGIILFMFVVGMELNWDEVKKHARDAIVISHAGIVFPFALGVIGSLLFYTPLAPPTIAFLPFALFMGIAMSITAFPVLASILRERKMAKSPLGTLSITCAAIDDVTAWCLFAVVIAFATATSALSAIFIIGLAIAYVLFMFNVVKPLLAKYYQSAARYYRYGINPLTISLTVLLLSAFTTKLIGIHSLFGAFLAGVVMPSPTMFRNYVSERTEHLSVILLLPIFFVYSGLRTQVGLINTPSLWLMFGLILVIAISGKLIGSAFTARYLGQSWGNSFRIGVLMNTRGLMELVVINLGYEMGILGPEIFTMMVLMALVTTLMTGPLLNLVDRVAKKDVADPANIPDPEPVLPEFLAEKVEEVGIS